MRTGLGAQAYTIVEVLIFLAVSLALFFAVARTINGQTTRSQFIQDVRSFESRLLDLANDVSTGYYAASNNFDCSVNAGGIVDISGGSAERGTNGQCILVGQVLDFDAADVASANEFKVISLAGSRYQVPSTQEVTNLIQANPKPIDTSVLTESVGAAEVVSVTYDDGVSVQAAEAVGFITTFGKYTGAKLDAGGISVDLVPINTPGPTTNAAQLNNALTAVSLPVNPTNGVKICLSGGINQFAAITLGGNGRRLSTKVAYNNGSCP